MKNKIKYYYQNTTIGFQIFKFTAKFYHFFLHKKYLSRQKFIEQRFEKYFGYNIDLKNPQTLNEKINWLILYDKNPLCKIIADKYEVRNYIKEKIGDKYLIPLVFSTKKPTEIIPVNLPEYPVIIKTNHNSSGGIIIRNKNSDANDWKKIQSRLRFNLNENYYWNGRELEYKDIERKIVIEKLLMDETGKIPEDFKVHCFNGKVRMINVDVNRGTENHFRNWYNRNWVREPYRWSSILGKNKFTNPSEIEVPKPKNLEEIIKLSEILAKDFIYLRVDWYILKDSLYFGELTLHHNGGCRPIEPKEWDKILGDELDLKINKI